MRDRDRNMKRFVRSWRKKKLGKWKEAIGREKPWGTAR